MRGGAGRYILRGVNAWLRGFGQVVFQPAVMSGVLFLAGIVWGALAEGKPSVLLGAIAGGLVSTVAGFLFYRREKGDYENGLWGFNGVLVGCALPTFLPSVWWMWLMLVVGAGVTPWLRSLMGRVKLNSLTFPFVVVTWCLILVARWLCHGGGEPVALFAEPEIAGWIGAMLKGVSEIFLIDSWITGVLFLFALSAGSLWAALMAAAGAGVGALLAWLCGYDMGGIADGLYGFNPALVAVAVATVFNRVSVASVVIAIVSAVVAFFVGVLMAGLFTPLGLPLLTAPFCIVTWIAIFLSGRLRQEKIK